MNTATDQVMSGAKETPLLTRSEELGLFAVLRSGEKAQQYLSLDNLVVISRNCHYRLELSDDRTSSPTLQEKMSMKVCIRGMKARQELIARNRRLVMDFAKRYRNRSQSDFDDIYQAGLIGLNRAIDKFIPSKGNRFSTYAYAWIRHHASICADSISRNIKIPLNVLESIQQIKKIIVNFQHSHKTTPTDIQIVEEFNCRYLRDGRSPLTVKNLSLYSSALRPPSSLDYSIGDSGQTLIDLVVAPDSCPLISDIDSEIFFEQATIGLKSNEVAALRLHVFNDYTLTEVCNRTGISNTELRKLKEKFRSRGKLLVLTGFSI